MAVIYFVMGVSGSGKTTIAQRLSELKNIPLFDADDFHSTENKAKMSAGQPLNDEDRKGWLDTLNKLAIKQSHADGAVIACSALKESYRKILTQRVPVDVRWIVLMGGFELIHQRMTARVDHFMPAGLLTSQLESMEYPPYGIHIDISHSPSGMMDLILHNESLSEFGLAGLGVMGKSLARNLGAHGLKLSLFNQHVAGKEENVALNSIAQFEELRSAKGFDLIEPFVQSLSKPRKIFLMVPAGKVVDHMITALLPYLSPGDIVMDGGNSHFKDTERRHEALKSNHIHFVGIGVSGGEQGALTGPAIMPGGDEVAYDSIKPILNAIAAKDHQGLPCSTYIGPGGAGHFVKMIHNGIEYAEMQILAEVYWILKKGLGFDNEQIALSLEEWNKKSAASYLLEITYKILRHKTGIDYTLDLIADLSGSKGTGSWSLTAAAELGMSANLISESLFARFVSSLKTERKQAASFAEIEIKPVAITLDQLYEAFELARLINHHQGFEIMRTASEQYGWNLNLSEVARIWTNGCIIRSVLMQSIQTTIIGEQNLLVAQKQAVGEQRAALAQVVANSLSSGIPIPALSAALNFILAYSSENLPANLIQAQRDFFGAHTYRKQDDPYGISYHTEWE
ncbi:MAG: NADP-dependent phosphogluconate dehydrogenase [Saprospiraceae bacterium]|nr:NADP-dependent phosphogluconate dehydrogenase [Saprospiraceae bacterium]MBK7606238.1 NADP-dependent phosphogluconate dehydrogenase [Saprospiraceae bacterium]MBK8511188.1 NADP-dependent phosphogluconate dehydrogenase [Saprospiraceae bacterium]